MISKFFKCENLICTYLRYFYLSMTLQYTLLKTINRSILQRKWLTGQYNNVSSYRIIARKWNIIKTLVNVKIWNVHHKPIFVQILGYGEHKIIYTYRCSSRWFKEYDLFVLMVISFCIVPCLPPWANDLVSPKLCNIIVTLILKLNLLPVQVQKKNTYCSNHPLFF